MRWKDKKKIEAQKIREAINHRDGLKDAERAKDDPKQWEAERRIPWERLESY